MIPVITILNVKMCNIVQIQFFINFFHFEPFLFIKIVFYLYLLLKCKYLKHKQMLSNIQ